MKKVKSWLVWLSRIHRCWGFGIQSPTDYAFVRYVVNEHWPYYAYSEFKEKDWLTLKLGKLYFRLANWRQPSWMLLDAYQRYWASACQKIYFAETIINKVELARVDIEDEDLLCQLMAHCDNRSVLVVEGIYRHWKRWYSIQQNIHVGTTFDLYYCGIVFFDISRYKHHYQINF